MMAIGNGVDPELAVEGGMLELEEDESTLYPVVCLKGDGSTAATDESSLSTPLLLSSSSLSSPEIIIEQTLRADGSIAIKASTVTPHPNGYQDVKIEHFVVPASEAESVAAPGMPPPSADYLTRVEYRVLSPGLELEPPEDDCSTVYTAPLMPNKGDGCSVSTAQRHNKHSSSSSRRKRHSNRCSFTLLLVSCVFILFVALFGVAMVRDFQQDTAGPASPTKGDDSSQQQQEDVQPISPANNEPGGGEEEEEDEAINNTTSSSTASPPPMNEDAAGVVPELEPESGGIDEDAEEIDLE